MEKLTKNKFNNIVKDVFINMLLEEVQSSDQLSMIIDRLRNKKFSDDIIARIEALTNIDTDEYNEAKKLLIAMNIPDKYADNIVRKAYSYKAADSFFSYIKNRTLKISEMQGTTIQSALGSSGINSDFLHWLVNYTWPKIPVMGTGEIALAILFDGGEVSLTKGDIKVDGREVEIKGSGGRLRGQKGFGIGINASKYWEKELNDIVKRLKIDVQIPKGGSNAYNMTVGNWFVDDIAPILIEKGVTKNEIANMWAKGFENIFIDGDFSWVKEYINEDGTISNRAVFKEQVAKKNIEYYMEKEDIDIIMIIERSGKTGYITLDNLDSMSDIIKISSYPSFTSSAGPQGSVIQISLK